MALKLFNDSAVDLVKDGLYHADVAVENLQSQGVCKSLKGTVEWTTYCMFFFSTQCCVITEKLTCRKGVG